ncbi:hypothetical protein PHISP_07164 [Aspergillus sp. HF37]|nr:hypothetical protein PHISP_07164 [Aspergillus sp. HF37]
MHFFRVLLALVAATLASAQVPDLPQCSMMCFIDALATDGCTPLTNFACHCQQPSLVEDVTPCVRQNCDKAAQSSVSSIVVSICSEAGHPVTIPPINGASTTLSAATSVSTTAAGATSAVSTGSASETGESVSETATATITATAVPAGTGTGSGTGTGATGLATPPRSSPTPASSGPLISSSGGSSSAVGSGSSPVSGSASVAPTSSTTSIPIFPGAATNVQSNVAGVVGIAVVAIAAFAL